MNEKRKQILEAAIKYFSKKGYFSTSMQEIAEDCGVSKGSLYKYFDSKEDVLIQVFEYNHEKMFERARGIHLDQTLSPYETFKKTIIIELEGMLENRDFFNILYKTLPKENNKQIVALIKRTRAAMLSWHKHLLFQAYGSKPEPFIWDIVMTFQGMIKEFIQLTVQERKPVELESIAEYIVRSLDAIIERNVGAEPVLSSEIMREYEEFDLGWKPLGRTEQARLLLTQLKEQLTIVALTNQDKDEMNAAIDLIDHELCKDQPREFLVHALLAYLKKNQELSDRIKQIESLV
ncbi:TetR/AcrR family transcriptional regulator [Sediminibacillus albus]|uniref:DNA-binding transcriptional regulator, AcrR family n=1 Tax=Sediminibacillus albus TaxID=407036 RepID=A0A1G9ANF4_9BACI|nr:TetR/AcrR family transcriptional regulator [Sediminibacillus albus]SDK28761.1 DNA-binding transcriptional regulator, AcrR family [Sediminibacillus albus]